MRSNVWHSLKIGVQILLLALMESAWIVGLGVLLSSLLMPKDMVLPLSSLAVVGIWLGGALPIAWLGLNHRFLALGLSLLLALGAIYIGLAQRFAEANLLALLGDIQPNLGVIVAVMALFAWIRGLVGGMQMAVSTGGLADGNLFGRFRIGLIMIGVITAVALALGISGTGSLLHNEIGGLILSFLVFALVNLAWANLEEATIELSNRGAQSTRPRTITWVMGVGAVAVVILIMGRFLGGVENSPLGILFEAVTAIAMGIFLAISLVVGFFAGLLVPVVQFIIGTVRNLNLPDPFKPTAKKPASPLNLGELFKSIPDLNGQEDARIISIWIAAIVLGLLALWVFTYFSIKKLLADPKSERPSDTMRVRFGSWGLFWRQLRDWLVALWRMLLKRLGLLREPEAGGVGEIESFSGAEGQRLRDIRQIYRRFQRLAARAGQPRRPHITPREYLSQLRNVYPNLPPSALTLTQTYSAARYGNLPPSEQQVAQANAALTEAERFFSQSTSSGLEAGRLVEVQKLRGTMKRLGNYAQALRLADVTNA